MARLYTVTATPPKPAPPVVAIWRVEGEDYFRGSWDPEAPPPPEILEAVAAEVPGLTTWSPVYGNVEISGHDRGAWFEVIAIFHHEIRNAPTLRGWRLEVEGVPTAEALGLALPPGAIA